MLKKSILPITLTMMLLSQGCNGENNTKKEETAKETKIQVKKAENGYKLSTLDNGNFTIIKEKDGFKLKEAKGKIVIYDIFATWCPPCKASASHLSSLQKKYKDDLIIIGLSIEDNISDEKLLAFQNQNNAHYALVNSNNNRKVADEIVFSLGLGERYPIPLLAMYKDGKLINHFVGMTQEELIESDIKTALGR